MCDVLGTEIRAVSAIDRAVVKDLDTKGCADKTTGQNTDIGWPAKAFSKTIKEKGQVKKGAWH